MSALSYCPLYRIGVHWTVPFENGICASVFVLLYLSNKSTIYIYIYINNYIQPDTFYDILRIFNLLTVTGYAVALLVEALCYKPEGRGFDSRWG